MGLARWAYLQYAACLHAQRSLIALPLPGPPWFRGGVSRVRDTRVRVRVRFGLRLSRRLGAVASPGLQPGQLAE